LPAIAAKPQRRESSAPVAVARSGAIVAPEEELRDPYVLEFLDLKDTYSESDLEAALTAELEAFLLELGGDFAFIGRQRRLRVGDEWYRIDLLFFHRRLRCLVVIDLKLGKFTHADAGQMHLYLNYAREHWTLPDEDALTAELQRTRRLLEQRDAGPIADAKRGRRTTTRR
jgi:predicted nuclease of restriction endonuclease-like (RecB) superfamily